MKMSMFDKKNMPLLVVFVLVGLVLGMSVASGDTVIVGMNHWSRNKTQGFLFSTNSSDDVNLSGNSLLDANLSIYAGDNISWDVVDMEFDVSADGTSKWNDVGGSVLYTKTNGIDIQCNGSLISDLLEAVGTHVDVRNALVNGSGGGMVCVDDHLNVSENLYVVGNVFGTDFFGDDGYFDDFRIFDSLYHRDDTDTRLFFEDDEINLRAGGVTVLEVVSDAIECNGISLDDADLSGYAGDNVDWDAGNGEFDVDIVGIGDAVRFWNRSDGTLYTSVDGDDVQVNGTVTADDVISPTLHSGTNTWSVATNGFSWSIDDVSRTSSFANPEGTFSITLPEVFGTMILLGGGSGSVDTIGFDDTVNLTGHNLTDANLSDYAGDNLVWDGVDMEFDASASGGGGNPFDQDLNSSDSPVFNNLNITNQLNFSDGEYITDGGDDVEIHSDDDIDLYCGNYQAVNVNGNIIPTLNMNYDLGSDGLNWDVVFATNLTFYNGLWIEGLIGGDDLNLSFVTDDVERMNIGKDGNVSMSNNLSVGDDVTVGGDVSTMGNTNLIVNGDFTTDSDWSNDNGDWVIDVGDGRAEFEPAAVVGATDQLFPTVSIDVVSGRNYQLSFDVVLKRCDFFVSVGGWISSVYTHSGAGTSTVSFNTIFKASSTDNIVFNTTITSTGPGSEYTYLDNVVLYEVGSIEGYVSGSGDFFNVDTGYINVTGPHPIVRKQDTTSRATDSIVEACYDSDGNMLYNFSYSDTSNKDIELRFGDDEHTRIGFPEDNYFAFLNDFTEFWLGNAADKYLFFNYYVGEGEHHGTADNLQNVQYNVNYFDLMNSRFPDERWVRIEPPTVNNYPINVTFGDETDGIAFDGDVTVDGVTNSTGGLVFPTSIPASPVAGSVWLNCTTNEIGSYDGTSWKYR